ncbi:hypothetical protein quinque_002355 [Culex quinquefasciatus]
MSILTCESIGKPIPNRASVMVKLPMQRGNKEDIVQQGEHLIRIGGIQSVALQVADTDATTARSKDEDLPNGWSPEWRVWQRKDDNDSLGSGQAKSTSEESACAMITRWTRPTLRQSS